MTRPLCPRCATDLFADFNEARCPTCGWHDWHHALLPAPKPIPRTHSATSLRFTVPYEGHENDTDHDDIWITVHRTKGGQVTPRHTIACPFCANTMTPQFALLRGRPNRRYKCRQDHDIVLLTTDDGAPHAWR